MARRFGTIRMDLKSMKPHMKMERQMHGEAVRYFKDGSTRTEIWVQDTGKQIEYREDGSKIQETPLIDGKPHGMEIWVL